MKYRLGISMLCMMVSSVCYAEAHIIDNFEQGIKPWKSQLRYGNLLGTKIAQAKGLGRENSAAFKIDYLSNTKGMSHILYYRDIDTDLDLFSGVELWVKASNLPAGRLLVYLADGKGKTVFYPLKALKPTACKWQNLKVSFWNSCPEEGRLDFKTAKTIGLMVQSKKAAKGQLIIDNLALTKLQPGAWLANPIITPNGDGVLDKADIRVQAVAGTPITVAVQNARGQIIENIAKQTATGKPMFFDWHASRGKTAVPAGHYTIVVTLGKTPPICLSVMVKHRAPWKNVKPQKKEFMPVGVFVEGSPANVPYPNNPVGAKAYYDRSFKNIAAMGFNTVAITWVPDALWPVCLKSAQENNLKVIMQVPALAGMVRSHAPLNEAAIADIVAKAKTLTKGYEDVVVRYMTADEPKVTEMPRWAVIHRILCAMSPDCPGMSIVCDTASMSEMRDRVFINEAAFDYYSQKNETPIPSAGTLLNYLTGFRKAAGDRPLWAVLQTFASNSGWRYPQPIELRLSVYQSLAAGCRGQIFFIYNSVPNSPEDLRGLVDKNGNPTHLAPEASLLAKELKTIFAALADFPAKSFSYTSQGSVRIGIYKNDGRQAIIVANTSPKNAYQGTLKINVEGKFTDILSKKIITINNNELKLDLPPAGGVVLVSQ